MDSQELEQVLPCSGYPIRHDTTGKVKAGVGASAAIAIGSISMAGFLAAKVDLLAIYQQGYSLCETRKKSLQNGFLVIL
jgi:hypothetical protein